MPVLNLPKKTEKTEANPVEKPAEKPVEKAEQAPPSLNIREIGEEKVVDRYPKQGSAPVQNDEG